MSNIQRQAIESVTPLAGSGTAIGATKDMESTRAGALGVSVSITRDAADTDVDIHVEVSHDASLWRIVETTNLAVTAGALEKQFDKTFQATRKFMRARIVNKTANGLSETEFITVRKENP